MADQRGFTLIEVMVAVSVLAIGLVGFVQAALLAARLESRSRAMIEGALIAEAGIERVGALGWERATAGLARAAAPELLGTDEACPQEALPGAGMDFLRVYRREEAADGTPRCAVHCFWRDPGGQFDRRRAVRIVGARPR